MPLYLSREAYNRFRTDSILGRLQGEDDDWKRENLARPDFMERLAAEDQQARQALPPEMQPPDDPNFLDTMLDRLDQERGQEMRQAASDAPGGATDGLIEPGGSIGNARGTLEGTVPYVPEDQTVPYAPEGLEPARAQPERLPFQPRNLQEAAENAFRLGTGSDLPRPGENPFAPFKSPEETVNRTVESLQGRKYGLPGPGGLGLVTPQFDPDLGVGVSKLPKLVSDAGEVAGEVAGKAAGRVRRMASDAGSEAANDVPRGLGNVGSILPRTALDRRMEGYGPLPKGALPPIAPPGAQPEHLAPLGWMDISLLPEAAQAELRAELQQYADTRVVRGLDEMRAQAATVAPEQLDEWVQRYARLQPGEEAVLEQAARATDLRLREQVASLRTKLDADTSLNDAARKELTEQYEAAKLKQGSLFLALTLRGSEWGRVGRLMREVVDATDAATAVRHYEDFTRAAVDDTARTLTREVRTNGAVGKNGQKKLTELQDALEGELRRGQERRPPTKATPPGDAPGEPKPQDRDKELLDQLVELTHRETRARDASDWEAMRRIQEEREPIREELKTLITERMLKAAEKEKGTATQETVDQLLAQEIKRVLAREVREAMTPPETVAGRLGEQVDRRLQRTLERQEQQNQKMAARMSIELEKRLNHELRAELRFIWNNQEIARLRAAGQDVPENLVREQQRIYAELQRQARESVAEARAAGRLNPPTPDELDQRAASQLKARVRRLEEQAQGSPRLAEAAARRQEMAAQRMAVQQARQLNRGVERQLAKEARTGVQLERQVEAGINRELAKETLEIIGRIEASAGTREQRQHVNLLLRQLSNLHLEGEQAAKRYVEQRNRRASAPLLRQLLKDVPLDEQQVVKDRIVQAMGQLDWTDTRAAQRFARAMTTPKFGQYVQAWRVLSMISGTPSLSIQSLSHLIEAGMAAPARAVSAADETIRTLGGRRRPVEATLAEVPAELQGFYDAWPRAMQEALETLRTGFGGKPYLELKGRPGDPLPVNWRPNLTSPRQLATTALSPANVALNAVGRYIQAADTAGWTVSLAAAERAERLALAKRLGKRVSEIDILEHPEVVERAYHAAESRTYMEALDGTWRTFNALRRNPAINQLIPFFHTLANIVKIGVLERTPVGLVRAERMAKEGELREAATLRGAAWLGTGFMTYGVLDGLTGSATAYGPRDSKERDSFFEQNGAMFAKRIGDTGQWVNYIAFTGAWGIPYALGVIVGEAARYGNQETELIDKVGHTAGEVLRNTFSMGRDLVGLRGLSDIFNFNLRPDAATATRLAGGYVSSYMPLTGALASATRALDTEVKDPDGALEYVLSRLPGFSQQVPAATTRLGETRHREPAGLATQLPMRITRAQPNPIEQEYQRLRAVGQDVGLTTVETPRAVDGIPLRTKAEQQEYAQLIRQKLNERLSKIIASPSYQRKSPYNQVKKLKEQEQWARDKVEEEFYTLLMRRLSPAEREDRKREKRQTQRGQSRAAS